MEEAQATSLSRVQWLPPPHPRGARAEVRAAEGVPIRVPLGKPPPTSAAPANGGSCGEWLCVLGFHRKAGRQAGCGKRLLSAANVHAQKVGGEEKVEGTEGVWVCMTPRPAALAEGVRMALACLRGVGRGALSKRSGGPACRRRKEW